MIYLTLQLSIPVFLSTSLIDQYALSMQSVSLTCLNMIRFALAVSLMTAAFTAKMSVAKLNDLYTMSLLAGFTLGAHSVVTPSIISDLFGMQSYARTYTFFQLAPALGAYILGTLLIGTLYHSAALSHHDDKGYCLGRECYGPTWAILTGLNIMSVMGTWVLVRTSRGAYNTATTAGKWPN